MSGIPANLPIYPHLGMTEEEQIEICEKLFALDPVIQRYHAKIEELKHGIADYERRAEEHLKEAAVLETQEDEVRAELKKLTTLRRSAQAQAGAEKYHARLRANRVKLTESAINKRKRQLYMAEARRRLGELGKELKLGVGKYRAGRGLGTVVVDKPNEDQTAQ